MTSNPPLNSKLLYLPIREIQIYLNNLEIENEKLKSELTTFSRFNCILENIRRSSNKGFNALQIIDRNKSCVCNEHMNGQIRRVAQEADIELRVWQEQYDKLMMTTKQDFVANCEEDNRSSSLSPRSSTGVPSPEHNIESEPETNMSLGWNTNDTNYNRNHSPVVMNSRTASISLDNSTNDSGFRSDFSDKSEQNNNYNNNKNNCEKQNNIRDEAVVRYISQIPVTDQISSARSTPQVVYESRKECRLVCDWPNCNRVFLNEDILTHHRRNHIRKSIYSCDFCSTRLLSKEELDSHMKKHILKPEPESDKEDPELIVEEYEDEDRAQNIDIENSSEAVNLSNKDVINGSSLNTSVTSLNNIYCTNINKLDKNALTFQSVLFERLSVNQKSTPPPPPAINNTGLLLVDNTKVSPQMRSDEYKRTRYSGVGRYRCPWPDCGYTPHFLRDLRRHMYKHTGDKKHKCDYPGCDFVSVWKTSLLQHQRKKHFAINQINTNDNLFNISPKISV